jgi:hypothetical protein
VPPGLPQNVTLIGQGVNSQSLTWQPATPGSNAIASYNIYRNGSLYASGVTPTLLTSFALTGTAGQFSCAAATLAIGMMVQISGPFGGTGSITGYSDPTNYIISATNGSTTGTLQQVFGVPIVTTAGTPSGLTVGVYAYTDSSATNTAQNNTFAPSTVYAYTIAAVDTASQVGAQQTQVTYWLYQNGVPLQQAQDFSFNATPNWASTAVAPAQGTFEISFGYVTAGSGFQPVSYPNMAAENFGAEVGAFNYLLTDVYITNTNETIFHSCLSRPGYPGGTDYFDWAQVNLIVNGASAFGTPVLNGWATLKVPLSLLSMGVSTFNGYISGTTLTMVGGVISGPGPDNSAYITGAGVAAGTFINDGGVSTQGGPFAVSVSQTVGSAGSPILMTARRTNYYKLGYGCNSPPVGFTYYYNNIRFTVN